MSDKRKVIHVRDLVIEADNVFIEPRRRRPHPGHHREERLDERRRVEAERERRRHDHERRRVEGARDRRKRGHDDESSSSSES